MTVSRRSLIAAVALLARGLRGQTADDGLLHDRVHRKLNSHRSLRVRDLKVEVRDGVVTIDGFVRSAKLKSRATKVASMKGVKKVINRLVVSN